MQYSLNNYVKVYRQDDLAPAADEYPGWFADGLEQGLPAAAPGEAPGDAFGDFPDALPDAALPDGAWAGLEHDPMDELPEDWSDYFDDIPAGDSGAGWRGNSEKRPGPAPAVGEEAAPPAVDGDDEAFVEFDLAVPVHGLTLRQAVAAVSRAVREKRDELEAWGFHARGDFQHTRPDKVFRWRFLGYKNGLMRYRAQRAISNYSI